MKVRDIMTTNVVSCRKDTDLATAARLMLDNRCGTMPVVDEQSRVAGIITDRDIAMAAATRQRNAAHIAVHEAMSGHVKTCLADDDIGAALHVMEERRVRRLPVLDGNGHLAGILSIDDIVLRGLDWPGGSHPQRSSRPCAGSAAGRRSSPSSTSRRRSSAVRSRSFQHVTTRTGVYLPLGGAHALPGTADLALRVGRTVDLRAPRCGARARVN
jgi:CBS domain-containing protein